MKSTRFFDQIWNARTCSRFRRDVSRRGKRRHVAALQKIARTSRLCRCTEHLRLYGCRLMARTSHFEACTTRFAARTSHSKPRTTWAFARTERPAWRTDGLKPRTGHLAERTDDLRAFTYNLNRCQGNLLRARKETRNLWRGRCAAVPAAGVHDDAGAFPGFNEAFAGIFNANSNFAIAFELLLSFAHARENLFRRAQRH